MSFQLSFLDNPQDDRPLPLIVADKWQFDLASIERDDTGEIIYCARDWYIGLGGLKPRWSASKSDWLTIGEPVAIEVKRPRRPVEKLEFVKAEGLYSIAARMRNDSLQLAEIKDYLAKAGVLADELRRNPETGVDVTIDAYAMQGKDNQWITERIDGKVSNKRFRQALVDAVAETVTEFQHATAQNTVYEGLWNRTAAQLKSELGLKQRQSLRDNQPTLALVYQRLAEHVIAHELSKLDGVSFEDARRIVYKVAVMVGSQAAQTGQALGVDLATGKALLGGGQ